MSFDLGPMCQEHNLRECGSPVRDCPAYVARIESETREAVSEFWPASVVDFVSAHMLALMWGESRLNRCGIGPGGRRVLGLRGRNPHSYTESEVRAALEGLRTAARVDLGPGQILFRYARKCDGGRATVEDLIGAGAVKTVACNLHYRQALHPRSKTPWGYWPGNRYSVDYARKVGRLAARIMRGK
jgi:hypothetical protein